MENLGQRNMDPEAVRDVQVDTRWRGHHWATVTSQLLECWYSHQLRQMSAMCTYSICFVLYVRGATGQP